MPTNITARLALSASPGAVRMARRYSADVLHDWGLDELVADVALVVSELVTNAVVHPRPSAGSTNPVLVLSLVRCDEAVVIVVVDDDPRPPVWRYARSYDVRECGRGLHVIRSLSQGYGWEQQGAGKAVWAQLRAPAGTAR